ncbi:hypothetical protein ACIRVF_07900 [Kitasatospora sp. NPDC101157]|uniref:hypothetical protein n=1 Tax=Kitasatospora sp. NPDC101157 TaxID=3364098 RepID=UPI0037F90D9F
MEDDFNLRKLIREVLNTSTMPDPHDVAREVLRRIHDDDLRTALSQCLSDVVREQIRAGRNGDGGGPPLPPMPTPAAGRPQTPTVRLVDPAPINTAKVPQAQRSAKVAAYRAFGQQWLRERMYVSGDPRGWKFMGDCTFDDLMFAAAQRRDQAARTTAVAERCERLAALLHTHGVTLVKELPADVLSGIEDVAA